MENTKGKKRKKMAIADIIKYEGDNTTFIWKHKCEDFNEGTKLIVHESQEALFFANGALLDIFGPGEHYLESGNLPVVKRVLGLGHGGKTSFHCELYFANLTEQMAVRWGTDSKIYYLDPIYKFPLELGACGEMSLSISNSSKLLIKVVGTEHLLSQTQLVAYFRSFLLNRVKSMFTSIVTEKKYSVFDIDMHLGDISNEIKNVLTVDFSEYGISLNSFFVTTVVKPDDDRNFIKFKEIHFRQYTDVAEAELRQKIAIIEQQTKSQQTVMEAEAIARKRQIEGYTYQQEKGFEVAKSIADNESVGQYTNLGVGLGMISGVGSEVSKNVSSLAGVAVGSALDNNVVGIVCSSCGASIPEGMMFCGKCGKRRVLNIMCKSCGFSFSDEFGFCPKCGTKREE